MPLVSVVIPIYNTESFLRETIDSVLCQTLNDFELILLDDGSTDHSVDIIHSYHDSRILFIPCPHDFIGTLNRGYGEAKGTYIAQMDSDDLMMPKRLQIQYDFMEANPHIAACGGWMHSFGKRAYPIRKPETHEQIVLDMLLHGQILNPTGFVRTEFLRKHQIKHEREYSFFSDNKFWSEIAKRGKLANIPQILNLYRTWVEQLTVKHLPELQNIKSKIRMEMIEYHLSFLNKKVSKGKQMQKLIPVLKKLHEQKFISDMVFFSFMHELIGGLKQHGFIQI